MSETLSDLTRPFLSGGGKMGALIRSHDWAATPLGVPETWPEVLRSALRICLSSAFPTAIYWGPDLILLYNDSWSPIPAERHPACLGRPARDVWADIWPIVGPQFAEVMRTGEGWSAFDQMLPMVRDGIARETYWDYSFTPLIDGAGVVRGILNQGNERTAQVLSDRRQAFRIALEDRLRDAPDREAIATRVVEALGRHVDADRVVYGTVSETRLDRLALFADGATARDLGGADELGEARLARLRAGETLVESDRPDGSDHAVPIDALRAVVAVPLLREGGLKAVLLVGQRAPRHWASGEVALVESIAARLQDAVERAQAEAALRESEAHLSSVFQQTGAGFAELDETGRFLSVNDQFCLMTRRERQELLGLTVAEITHPDSREDSARAIRAVIETGRPVTVEKQLLRPDGSTLWVANTKSLIAVRGRATILTVSIDITERKEAERALAEAKTAAEDANLAKSTFIANMSHELRTPLSAIIGYSEMMLEEIEDSGSDAAFAADVRKIESNARHLLGLINDVLDLSKIESGKMEVYAERFEVAPMLNDLATTVGSLIDRRHNRLALDMAPDLGEAEQDLVKLRQMLLNLLSNAAKFTDRGTITLKAWREGEGARARLVFRITDSGIGMSAEQLGRLFRRFQQADSSTTRRFGGTGLGLSLTKAFVDMLGGTIAVESEVGSGSAFTVTVPCRYAPPARGADEGKDPEGSTHAPRPARDVVLVIDDDEDQRALMTRFLKREGFEARTASDGEAGLALARDLKPRAILLDVMMPGLDGWAVLASLKADPALADIPVVMVTFVDQRAVAAQQGAADYVLKPVRWERFKAVMDRFRQRDTTALVIDDDADTRARMRGLLERDGWQVIEAADGREGLARFGEHKPGVVVLDLTMPVMDGFAFLERLRTTPGGDSVPVLVLTARDLTLEDRHHLAGANQILNKGDVSLRDLSRKLERLVKTEPGAQT